MARITTSALVGSITGTLGGVEFCRSQAGAFVKQRRRPRNPVSTASTNHARFLQIFADLWRSSSLDLRNAWNTFARDEMKSNLWGQFSQMRGFNSAMAFHLIIVQWYDWQLSGGFVLQPPPNKLYPIPAMTSFSADFSNSTGYTTTTSLASPYSVKALLWAGITTNGSWSGMTNFRFVGAQDDPQTPIDWTSRFARSPLNWSFLPGQRLWLKLVHYDATAPLYPNNRWLKLVTVTA